MVSVEEEDEVVPVLEVLFPPPIPPNPPNWAEATDMDNNKIIMVAKNDFIFEGT